VRFSRTHLVRRPDGAAFTVTGGEREAAGTYDGRYFTLLWRSENAYARVRTPPTLDETLDRLAERYKIPMPVGDLVASSPYDRLMAPGVEGRYVSREPIGGRDCEHLAYTEPRVDWEIWIAASSDPTPCQLVITTKGQSGPLTSKVNFSNWNLSASVPDGAFEARIPEGYERILMVPREPAAAESPAPPAEDKKP
jgi:hypothetical protein